MNTREMIIIILLVSIGRASFTLVICKQYVFHAFQPFKSAGFKAYAFFISYIKIYT
jgi:hypothetical protein